MSSNKGIAGFFCIVLCMGFISPLKVNAESIMVGTGDHHADVYIEFNDGGNYTFDVAFDGSTTGLGLFDIIEANTTLTTVRQNFGFGIFIDGITYDGHSNIGYGGGENWWHYWTKDPGDTEWISSTIGVADRIVIDGSSAGMIYGRASAVPEPTTLMTLALGLLGLIKRRYSA